MKNKKIKQKNWTKKNKKMLSTNHFIQNIEQNLENKNWRKLGIKMFFNKI